MTRTSEPSDGHPRMAEQAPQPLADNFEERAEWLDVDDDEMDEEEDDPYYEARKAYYLAHPRATRFGVCVKYAGDTSQAATAWLCDENSMPAIVVSHFWKMAAHERLDATVDTVLFQEDFYILTSALMAALDAVGIGASSVWQYYCETTDFENDAFLPTTDRSSRDRALNLAHGEVIRLGAALEFLRYQKHPEERVLVIDGTGTAAPQVGGGEPKKIDTSSLAQAMRFFPKPYRRALETVYQSSDWLSQEEIVDRSRVSYSKVKDCMPLFAEVGVVIHGWRKGEKNSKKRVYRAVEHLSLTPEAT